MLELVTARRKECNVGCGSRFHRYNCAIFTYMIEINKINMGALVCLCARGWEYQRRVHSPSSRTEMRLAITREVKIEPGNFADLFTWGTHLVSHKQDSAPINQCVVMPRNYSLVSCVKISA